ncbi:MAG: J domain-containing protein [Bifidobacterium sp.]|nr:J domain-containing protein [Bifidobacterium sp.]
MADYYETLGIDRTASEEEIKRAYRKMSRKYHPDLTGPENEEKYKEVNAAYEVLSDPDKRRMYDAGVDPNDPRGGAGAGFQGAFDMGDIFNQFFGGGFAGAGNGAGPIPRTQPGGDIETTLDVDLRTVVFGGTVPLSYGKLGTCETCKGTGSQDEQPPVTCDECHGTGTVQRVVSTLFGQMMTTSPCPKCEGHGTIILHPCPQCHGHGRLQVRSDLGVEVAGGIETGNRIRIRGAGDGGECNGTPGDLYVDIRVKGDDVFTRRGDDLHCWVQVPMTWAVLGHTMDVDTFDGEQAVEVPAGCQPEQTIALKQLGVKHLNGNGERGDLIVHVDVQVPTKLTDQERMLMEEFAKAHHDDEAQSVAQHSRPTAPAKKGFFSKLKDAFS